MQDGFPQGDLSCFDYAIYHIAISHAVLYLWFSLT